MRLVEVRRVSTEEQARDDRSGLHRQEHQNRQTADRLQAALLEPAFVISDVCRENIVDTPEWAAIRKLIVESDVHIVVDQQDRLVAGLAGVQILVDCERTGTRIFTSNGEVDVTTFTGQVMGLLGAAIASDELRKIRHRVQGGKEAKRRDGNFPSAAICLPTGIEYVRTKGQKDGHWTYNDDIQRVRDVFELVVHDGLRNWNEVGRQTGFSGQTVRNILRNHIYKGLWLLDEKRQPGPTPLKPDGRRRDRRKIKRETPIATQVFRPKGASRDEGDCREEAVVDATTWDSAQVILDEKLAAYYRPRDPVGQSRFTYTSILRCSACGTPIYGKTRPLGNSRRDWYVCKNAATSRQRCPNGYLARNKVNSALDRFFSRVLCDDRLIRGLVDSALHVEQADFSVQIQASTRDLARLRTQRTKLLDLYLDDGWSKADLDIKRSQIDQMITRKERELRRLKQAEGSARSASALEAMKGVLVALAEFEFWSPGQKRRLLKQFFPEIIVSRHGIVRVVVRLPLVAHIGKEKVHVPEHELPLTLNVGMSWDQLQPPASVNSLGLTVKTHYTRKDLAVALGLTSHQVVERIEKGIIPEPAVRGRGTRRWTLTEVKAIVRAVEAQSLPYRWGLPKKSYYSTPDVTRILDMKWSKLRHAIDTGRIQDCKKRNANGHRMWTEHEIETALIAIGREPGDEPQTTSANRPQTSLSPRNQGIGDSSGILSSDLHDP